MYTHFAINGKWTVPRESHLPLESRAHKYGDGFFESMLQHQGQILHLGHHYNRLETTARLLKIDWPFWLSQTKLQNLINQKCELENIGTARIRLAIYRHASGLYTPVSNESLVVIELVEAPYYSWNTQGVKLCAFKELTKNRNYTSTLKTCNALTYVMAAIYTNEQKANAALIFNEDGRIAEAHHSNIFLYNKNAIITPPISEYCVNGVMRKVIINIATAYGYQVHEQPITELHLASSDEVFLTNATQGIQWVGDYEGKVYKNHVAHNLYKKLAGV
jgi:branched-subunit amino acid aminotransferase/4-amino-4-deoxychorismate lyase